MTLKLKFHQNKTPISIKNIDINKKVVSNKAFLVKKGFKYFTGYKNAKKIRPLCVFLPKMSAYRREFDETKYMSFLIKNDELSEKYNEIWEKVKNNIKKEFDSELVCNEKYPKAKIESNNWKISTNFHKNEISKEVSQFIFLSVILINSVFRTGNNYYPQVFLDEFEYAVKEKKMSEYITDDVGNYSDSDRADSNEENSNEEFMMKKILVKEIKYLNHFEWF